MLLTYEVSCEQDVMDTFMHEDFFPTDKKVLVKSLDDAKDILLDDNDNLVIVVNGIEISNEEIDKFAAWYKTFDGNSLVIVYTKHSHRGGHHLNVNVVDREKLIDAMNNPGKYPQLCVRVSGYCVHYDKLSREQQEEVISRTFHEEV